MRETCDCWTDAEGYWQLGPECREVEREKWRRAMRAMPGILDMLRRPRAERRPVFVHDERGHLVLTEETE